MLFSTNSFFCTVTLSKKKRIYFIKGHIQYTWQCAVKCSLCTLEGQIIQLNCKIYGPLSLTSLKNSQKTNWLKWNCRVKTKARNILLQVSRPKKTYYSLNSHGRWLRFVISFWNHVKTFLCADVTWAYEKVLREALTRNNVNQTLNCSGKNTRWFTSVQTKTHPLLSCGYV